MIETAGLPRPLWNPRLYLDGDRLADPAAYWPRHGVLLETAEPARPVRHRVETAGLQLVHAPDKRLCEEPRTLLAALRVALVTGPHGRWDRVSIGPAPLPGY